MLDRLRPEAAVDQIHHGGYLFALCRFGRCQRQQQIPGSIRKAADLAQVDAHRQQCLAPEGGRELFPHRPVNLHLSMKRLA